MDYNNLIPKQINFSLRELEELGAVKISTAKKLIQLGKLTHTKIGNKIFIPRPVIIDYLNSNIVVGGL